MNDCDESPSVGLPPEIWAIVIDLVGIPAQKQLRLSCKNLSKLTTPILFKTIRFEATQQGCDSLKRVAEHPVLSLCVKNLVLQRTVRNVVKLNTWRNHFIDPPPCPSYKSVGWRNDNDSEDDDSDLLSHSEWLALPFNKKRKLYYEFQVDQKKGQLKATSHRLYQALTKLPNLTTFSHQPGNIFNKAEWEPFKETLRQGDNQDAEAFQLAIALQALGRSAHLYKLGLVSLCVAGPAFWGWKRLRYLCQEQSYKNLRAARQEFYDAEEADRMACWESPIDPDKEQDEMKAYSQQLIIMEHALVNITRLDCSVSEDGHIGALSVAAPHIFEFLRCAEKLEEIRLVFGLLVDGAPAQTVPEDKGPSILLRLLVEHKPWSNIRKIWLEVSTDQRTLIRFLSVHKDTLRTLTLSHVTLECYKDECWPECYGHWEVTLSALAESLNLDILTLSMLCDTVVNPTITDSRGRRLGSKTRKLFNPKDRNWQKNGGCYSVYYDAVIRHLLRGEKVISLDPEHF